MGSNSVLEIRNVTKKFSGTTALDNVSMRLQPGEIHALLGENGAGKSTLVKIISGEYTATKGEILLNGSSWWANSPQAAEQAGIVRVPQEPSVVEDLSIAENLFIGHIPSKGGFINYRKLYHDAELLLQEVDLKLDVKKKADTLSVANQQMLILAAALYHDLKVIILDEPTASITQQEAGKLFEIMEVLKEKGIAIIFISHRLDEVFQICDNITVLRDGKVSGQTAVKDSTVGKLVAMMVGREVVYPEKGAKVIRDGVTPVLEVKNLSLAGAFKDVSFKVYPGEILGLSGLMGSGRTEIAKTIFGVYKPTGGQIFLNGKEMLFGSPQKAIMSGIGMVPEDRKEEALFMNQSVRANLTFIIRKKISKLGYVIKKRDMKIYNEFQKKLAIKTASPDAYISGLSGGNQQKVIIGRWLAAQPDLLILDEPTRGIDVAAKAEVHKLMGELVKNGICILMISSELPEVLTMANRIIVMHEGRINGLLNSSEATEELIIRKASGL